MKARSEAWSLKHLRRTAFCFQLNPSLPYRSCAKSLAEKDCNSLQKCGAMDASCRGSSGAGGRGRCHGRKAIVNVPQKASEHWIQPLAAVHVYIYILRKLKCMVSSSFLGLLINHLRAQSRRRDSKIVPASSWGRKRNESLYLKSALSKCPPSPCAHTVSVPASSLLCS